MKRNLFFTLLFFVSIALVSSCGNSGGEKPGGDSTANKQKDSVIPPPKPVYKITWIDSNFESGHVKFENQPVTHEFKFKNEGNTPVSIISVISNTDVTHDFTVKPVEPGQEGMVKLSYKTDYPKAFRADAMVKFKEDSTLNRKLKMSGVVAGRK